MRLGLVLKQFTMAKLVYDRIVSESTDLFYKYGVSSVSTNSISLSTGISKRTFYQYFGSKEELIEVIVTNEIELAKKELLSLSGRNLNPVLEAISFCEIDLNYTKSHSINFLRDIKRIYPCIWTFYDKFKTEHLQNFLQSNIKKGIIQKYYWPDLNEELTVHLWMELSQLHYTYNGADVAVRNHFVRGLLNQKGISEFLFWQY